jgi:excisionase family DNA binding protein
MVGIVVTPELIEAIADRVTAGVVAAINIAATTRTPYLTVVEAAEYLRWSRERIYKLTAASAIPHVRHGSRILLRRDWLDAWMEEHREGPSIRQR